LNYAGRKGAARRYGGIALRNTFAGFASILIGCPNTFVRNARTLIV
jgi:hypothetical protein